MQIQLFDSYPYRPLGSVLRPWLARAQRMEAAVAFVTRAGVAMFRQFLKTRPPNVGLLVASVRFPTNLAQLANLEDDFPGTVLLHTGFQVPQEEEADRGQFHSKVMLLELSGRDRCLIVGSHNWTQNALEGYNLEAGVVIHCQETDPIIAQARQHIQNCANRSERFDRKRLRFYEAVQRDLHKRTGPGGQENEPFPGFQEHPALVIHAEDATDNGLPDPAQLFIPIDDEATYQMFTRAPQVGAEQRVTLHLYMCVWTIARSITATDHTGRTSGSRRHHPKRAQWAIDPFAASLEQQQAIHTASSPPLFQMLPLVFARASICNPLPNLVGAKPHHPADFDRPRSYPRTGPCPQRSFTDAKQLSHLLSVQKQLFIGDRLLRCGLNWRRRRRRLGGLWLWLWRSWAEGWGRTGAGNRSFECLHQGALQQVAPLGSVFDLDGNLSGDCQWATGVIAHGVLLKIGWMAAPLSAATEDC